MTRSRKLTMDLEGYLFVAPALLFFLAFIVYPIVFNVGIGFFSWRGIGGKFGFVGLGNYLKFFASPIAGRVGRNTALLLALMVPAHIAVGLIVAYLLDMRVRFTAIYRILFFIPLVIPGVVTASVFGMLLQPTFGALNTFLRSIGLGILAQSWLGDTRLVIFSIIAVTSWSFVGYAMVVYLGGLQGIPDEIREAAVLDGTSEPQMFFSIVFPLLRGCHATLVILGVLGVFRFFDIVWILTEGGPAQTSEVPATLVYRTAMMESQTGYAGAISVVILITCIILAILLLSVFRRR